MERDDAVTRAQRARGSHQVPDQAHVAFAERRFIELAGSDPNAPAPVRDVLAWIVRFQLGAAWVDLAVDDLTGEIVRVERSR